MKKLLCIKKDFEGILEKDKIYFTECETDDLYRICINNNTYWIKKFLFIVIE
ncbi:hypothetical protein [Clostridium weizhouense]|uniref:Uncharacterized protein n=1 Tax=Clostridium weizhouense TaxID=2859781 RepID=A0ABS7AJX3_9CLOT|nr:hypothetical protein [Clostridium weizhouense]MBW6408951.1 hypothetical protein [Clostridium weizhouense]